VLAGYSAIAFLSGCDSSDFTPDLAQAMYSMSFRAGEVIASSYDAASFYGIVQRGVVKSSIVTSGNRAYITGLLFKGQLVQPVSQSDRVVRFMEAASDTTLCCFAPESMEWIVREHPKVGRAIQHLLMQEIDHSRDWISLLGRRSVEEKLAGFLMLLARRAAHWSGEKPTFIEIPLKRSQIAEFLGITLESVSRGITALKRGKVIRLHDMRHFEVLHADLLATLAGE
jgi:CRP/FNR family transcriptional regulator